MKERIEIENLCGRYHLIRYDVNHKDGRVMFISKGWKTYNGAKKALDNFLNENAKVNA